MSGRGSTASSLFVCGDLSGTVLGFKVHVVDEDIEYLPTVEHVPQDMIWPVGMYMHLVVWVSADKQFAIALSGKILKTSLRVEIAVIGMEKELCAVAVLRTLPVVVYLDINGFGNMRLSLKVHGCLEVRDRGLLALVGIHEPFKKRRYAKGARVHNAVFLKDRKKVRGARN